MSSSVRTSSTGRRGIDGFAEFNLLPLLSIDSCCCRGSPFSGVIGETGERRSRVVALLGDIVGACSNVNGGDGGCRSGGSQAPISVITVPGLTGGKVVLLPLLLIISNDISEPVEFLCGL